MQTLIINHTSKPAKLKVGQTIRHNITEQDFVATGIAYLVTVVHGDNNYRSGKILTLYLDPAGETNVPVTADERVITFQANAVNFDGFVAAGFPAPDVVGKFETVSPVDSADGHQIFTTADTCNVILTLPMKYGNTFIQDLPSLGNDVSDYLLPEGVTVNSAVLSPDTFSWIADVTIDTSITRTINFEYTTTLRIQGGGNGGDVNDIRIRYSQNHGVTWAEGAPDVTFNNSDGSIDQANGVGECQIYTGLPVTIEITEVATGNSIQFGIYGLNDDTSCKNKILPGLAGRPEFCVQPGMVVNNDGSFNTFFYAIWLNWNLGTEAFGCGLQDPT